MIAQVHIEETERQALTRLLAKAKAEGVRIQRDRKDGRHHASSVSEPGKRHFVTGYSCDCRGFAAHQRCKHHAALLSALGWLPVTPEPQPPTAIRVHHVGGHYTLAKFPEWIEPVTTITVDRRDTVRITGETSDLFVWWIENSKPIDDMTGATPPFLNHYQVVDYWIRSLDASVAPHVLMQDAGLFPAVEFTNAQPLAA